jgi:hypothetical protein
MPLASVAAKIPWRQLILLAPDVAKGARAIWAQWMAKPQPAPIDPAATLNAQVAAISERILALESNEAKQSKLVSEIADQLQGIAMGLEETAARQTLIVWTAIAALVVSIASLFATFIA